MLRQPPCLQHAPLAPREAIQRNAQGIGPMLHLILIGKNGLGVARLVHKQGLPLSTLLVAANPRIQR